MEITTGHYVNVYSEKVDVFVILNESCSEPTTEDVDLIASVVEHTYKETSSREELRDTLQSYFDYSERDFAQYGVQVVVRKYSEAKETPIIELTEHYWVNDNGCHYTLTPVDAKFHDKLGQFTADTTSLVKAKSAAKKWMKKNSSYGAFIVIPAKA